MMERFCGPKDGSIFQPQKGGRKPSSQDHKARSGNRGKAKKATNLNKTKWGRSRRSRRSRTCPRTCTGDRGSSDKQPQGTPGPTTNQHPENQPSITKTKSQPHSINHRHPQPQKPEPDHNRTTTPPHRRSNQHQKTNQPQKKKPKPATPHQPSPPATPKPEPNHSSTTTPPHYQPRLRHVEVEEGEEGKEVKEVQEVEEVEDEAVEDQRSRRSRSIEASAPATDETGTKHQATPRNTGTNHQPTARRPTKPNQNKKPATQHQPPLPTTPPPPRRSNQPPKKPKPKNKKRQPQSTNHHHHHGVVHKDSDGLNRQAYVKNMGHRKPLECRTGGNCMGMRDVPANPLWEIRIILIETTVAGTLIFSVQRLLAFARSFNTFNCMLHRTGKLSN